MAAARVAGILVVVAGVPGFIGPEHVRPGATVIHVGVHRTPHGPTGDVHAAVLDGITARVNTVPGGIETTMTIAMLLVNTLCGGVARAATAGRTRDAGHGESPGLHP
ncbi:hypothetical protein [Streptomyces europaeiscabiei]|uniref:hypothetical protein n=1 Tax=Streptomyces europaeiscabiei TaxID=146819 RepID=UPI0039A6D5B2